MVDQTFRDSDPSKAVEIVEEHGSFLLVRTASGFAVIERRNGRIYPISPSEREVVPMTGEAIAMLLADQGISPRTRRGGSLAPAARSPSGSTFSPKGFAAPPCASLTLGAGRLFHQRRRGCSPISTDLGGPQAPSVPRFHKTATEYGNRRYRGQVRHAATGSRRWSSYGLGTPWLGA